MKKLRHLALAIIIAICISSAVATRGVSSSSKLNGKFLRSHTIQVYDADKKNWSKAHVNDQLVLSRKKNGKLNFSFVIVADNGHKCTMKGQAIGGPTAYTFKKDDCELRIVVEDEGIRLEDDRNYCKSINCGQKAYINGVTFSIKDRPKPKVAK